MTERRQHPRFRIRQLIKLDFGREDYLEARAVDIGEGGLRLCSGQPLEVGSRVFVMLSSKNAKGEEDFYHLLESHHEHSETTIVMVTHDWAAARHHATHVLLLKTHQVAFGPPAEVLTEANMRSAFGHVGHRHGQYWMEAPHA